MATHDKTKVLAVGVDAAEPRLVRALLKQGRLPVLDGLLQRGSWRRIKSPEDIGSGAVWPTFITGTEPAEHGIFGEWCWDASTMSLRHYHGHHLIPFWKDLDQRGVTMGLLDVPFAPVLGLSRGFEISEWGAHDVVEGRLQFSPSSIGGLLRHADAHPYSFDHVPSSQVSSMAELTGIRDGSLRGIESRGSLAQRLIDETRPDLAIIVFPETHHAGHYLWHTVAPDYPYYDSELRRSAKTGPTFADIYCAVDRQLEKLLRVVGDNASIFVFSLHGLRPTRGIPNFLETLMCEQGFAALTSWTSQTWRERSHSLIRIVKRLAPVRIKKIYYQTAPRQMTYRIAQPTMMASYDWSRTTAFALQSDQHGRIRINLAGREAKGIVPLEHYEEICRELDRFLRSLVTDEGQALVNRVIRTAASPAAAMTLPLPDLIVHLSDAAQQSPLKIKGSALEFHPISTKYTGQHDWDGFCVAVGEMPIGEADIQAKDLHRLLLAGL